MLQVSIADFFSGAVEIFFG